MSEQGNASEPENPLLTTSAERFLALLDEAHQGSSEALGQVIDACRQYLLSIANAELPEELRAKVAPSDLVQDSCLEAQQGFARFRGQTCQELQAWLRGILMFNLSNARRHYQQTAKRDLGLEIPLTDSRGKWQLASDEDSPSQAAIANEEQVLVEKALENLPEHLREAVLLRHREHLSFAEIGERMGRTSEAARKLWARGVEQLQKELQLARSTLHDSQA